MQIFKLDLQKEILFGFQGVYQPIVDSIMKGISFDDKFPPVVVEKRNDGIYIVPVRLNGVIDGGHHRAFAHLLAEKPLSCRLRIETEQIMYDETLLTHTPIRETEPALELPDEPGAVDFKLRQGHYANYR